MAFVPNDPTQDPNKQQQGFNPLAQQAPVTTSSAPGAGPAASSNPTGAQPSNQASAQPFTNLQAYLTANAPQITDQANKIAGQLTNQYGQLQGQIQSGVNQFNQDVQSGYTPPDQNVVNQATTNPTQFVQNPQNIKAFQSQLNDVYTGPSNFETTPGYADINKSVITNAQNADLVNTPEGLQTYLRQGNTNSTPGMNLLDAVLLQGSPEAITTVQKAAAPFKTLGDYLTGQVTQANQGVANAVSAADQARTNANTALTGATNTFANNVNQNFANAQQQYLQGQNQLNDYISKIQKPGLAGLKTAEMIRLGIDPAVISAFTGYPTVLNEWDKAFTPSPTQGQAPGSTEWTFPGNVPAPTIENISTPEDYATLDALTKLGGYAPTNSPIDYSTASQAGTYIPGTYSPTPNNKALAEDLLNYLHPLNFPSSPTPIGTAGDQDLALRDYNTLLNGLADYLGLPPINTNFPTPPPPDNGGGVWFGGV